jgi:hypothetical protein
MPSEIPPAEEASLNRPQLILEKEGGSNESFSRPSSIAEKFSEKVLWCQTPGIYCD